MCKFEDTMTPNTISYHIFYFDKNWLARQKNPWKLMLKRYWLYKKEFFFLCRNLQFAPPPMPHPCLPQQPLRRSTLASLVPLHPPNLAPAVLQRGQCLTMDLPLSSWTTYTPKNHPSSRNSQGAERAWTAQWNRCKWYWWNIQCSTRKLSLFIPHVTKCRHLEPNVHITRKFQFHYFSGYFGPFKLGILALCWI